MYPDKPNIFLVVRHMNIHVKDVYMKLFTKFFVYYPLYRPVTCIYIKKIEGFKSVIVVLLVVVLGTCCKCCFNPTLFRGSQSFTFVYLSDVCLAVKTTTMSRVGLREFESSLVSRIPDNTWRSYRIDGIHFHRSDKRCVQGRG